MIRSRMEWQSSHPQSAQNAALVDRVIRQVTITDLFHPLAACTVPLVHPVHTRSLPGRVVVRLPSCDHRAADCWATDPAMPDGSCPASAAKPLPVSAKILLTLAQHVLRLSNTIEECTNGSLSGLAPAPVTTVRNSGFIEPNCHPLALAGRMKNGSNPDSQTCTIQNTIFKAAATRLWCAA